MSEIEDLNKKMKELKKKYMKKVEKIQKKYNKLIDDLYSEMYEAEQELNNKWREEKEPLEEEKRNLFLQIVKKEKLLKGSEWEKINYSNKLICKDKILSNILSKLSGGSIDFTLLNDIKIYLYSPNFQDYVMEISNKNKEISFQDAVKLEEEYELIIKDKRKLK